MMVITHFIAKSRGSTAITGLPSASDAFKGAILALLTVVILLGRIYSGKHSDADRSCRCGGLLCLVSRDGGLSGVKGLDIFHIFSRIVINSCGLSEHLSFPPLQSLVGLSRGEGSSATRRLHVVVDHQQTSCSTHHEYPFSYPWEC